MINMTPVTKQHSSERWGVKTLINIVHSIFVCKAYVIALEK